MSNDDDDMNSDRTPEEEDVVEDYYREQLKNLDELPPPTDPGEIRARKWVRKELKRRIKECEERKSQRDSEG